MRKSRSMVGDLKAGADAVKAVATAITAVTKTRKAVREGKAASPPSEGPARSKFVGDPPEILRRAERLTKECNLLLEEQWALVRQLDIDKSVLKTERELLRIQLANAEKALSVAMETVGAGNALRIEHDKVCAERDRLQAREEHIAKALSVADGGRYRSDFDGAIRRCINDRNEAQEIASKATFEWFNKGLDAAADLFGGGTVQGARILALKKENA